MGIEAIAREEEYSMGLVYNALLKYMGSHYANGVRDNAAEALKGKDGNNSRKLKKLTASEFGKVVDYLIDTHPGGEFDRLNPISLNDITANYKQSRDRRRGSYCLALGVALFAAFYLWSHLKPKEAGEAPQKKVQELVEEEKPAEVISTGRNETKGYTATDKLVSSYDLLKEVVDQYGANDEIRKEVNNILNLWKKEKREDADQRLDDLLKKTGIH